MRIARYAIALLLLLSAVPAYAADSASQRLERLTAEAQERILDLFPVGETMGRGAGPRQDRLELTFTDEHRERQREHQRWVLRELEGIPAAELSETEKLTHELLAYRARDALGWLRYPFHQHVVLIQIDGGVTTNLIKLLARQPFRNEADYRAWERRLARYPQFLDGIAGVLRDGMRTGLTIPRVILERSVTQLDALAPADMEKSALWGPMTRFPESIAPDVRVRIEADYRKLVSTEVFPALRRLAAFVRDDYMPRARTSDGYSALPEGDRMYRVAVRNETSTDLTPDEIHALGLKEVKRIQPLWRAAGQRAGFNGTFVELESWMKSNPQNYPFTSTDQVLEYLNRLHARILPQLPLLFTRLPKARFEIRLTEPELVGTQPAQWTPPSDDGTRPGIFRIPIYDAREQSIFGLASLLAHEGMPGHHFDGGLKLENKVPEFRRRMWVNAFGEGWALYAESLGHELGLYEEPLELMGRYHFELFRACRLVIDTGLHAFGWTRERAIRYFTDECGMAERDATIEVLRYMVWPGQALGYKVGELTILDLRRKAQERLGARFDIRTFHDAVLAEGHLPMSMLKTRMETWIAARAGDK